MDFVFLMIYNSAIKENTQGLGVAQAAVTERWQ